VRNDVELVVEVSASDGEQMSRYEEMWTEGHRSLFVCDKRPSVVADTSSL
jgi:hypothetical protein